MSLRVGWLILFLVAGLALPSSIAGAQTGDARSIEGQTAVEPEHRFRMTLPSGWEFDPLFPPSSPTRFSFTHQSDPKQKGRIETSERFHNETARAKLEVLIIYRSGMWAMIGAFFEAGPVVDTRLGGEEAASFLVTFEDEEGVLRKEATVLAVRGENAYELSISAPADRFDALQADVEFIKKSVRFE